jgi:UDP-N-acetyl-D-glucosamine dehydrogenase
VSAAGDGLLDRLRGGDASVAVMGLGYVGLPLVIALHAKGLRVLGVDLDPTKAERLSRGEAYLSHIGQAHFDELSASDRFSATDDMAHLGMADAVCVCVPTPLGEHREPDLSAVERAGGAIGAALAAAGCKIGLVCLESTTFPGTTRGVFAASIRGGLIDAGVSEAEAEACLSGIGLAYSPEREDPGNAERTAARIPKLVGGIDERSADLACALYEGAAGEVVRVSSAEVAEAAKLLENVFRAVNIAMVNELKVMLSAMGVDVWEVIRAASTKPFGFMPFYPGPGLGGHCIPIDPFYLSWKAREVGEPAAFIELAGEVNHRMPAYVIDRLWLALNGVGKAVRGARVLVLGLAYKPNVDDVRESPSFEVIARLRALGADVRYHDPHVPKTWPMRRYDLSMTSVDLTTDELSSADAVVICTAHAAVDYGAVAKNAKLIVDTRDTMRPWAAELGDRLVRA